MVVAGLLCKYRLDREALSSYFAFGREIKWGRRDGTGNPLATVYRCKDGKAFWLTGFEADRHWPATVRAVGQSEWLNRRSFRHGQIETGRASDSLWPSWMLFSPQRLVRSGLHSFSRRESGGHQS